MRGDLDGNRPRFSGARARAARAAAGMYQGEVAACAGRSPAAVSAYERGRSAPPAGVLLDCAVVLGVEPEELYGPGVREDRALDAPPVIRRGSAPRLVPGTVPGRRRRVALVGGDTMGNAGP